MACTNSWDSTDQIPQRAVLAGSLDRFGAVDQTDGGDAQRFHPVEPMAFRLTLAF